MASPTQLFDLCKVLQAAIEGEFVANGLDLPETRYVSAQQPTPMCDSLVVTWASIGFEIPGVPSQPLPLKQNVFRSAAVIVWLFRCLTDVPSGQGQELLGLDPAAAEADALMVMTDGLVIHRAVVKAHYAGTFGTYATALSIGPATPISPPQSGIGGTVMQIQTELI